MGKASKRKNQRRQGTGQSRADFERRRGVQATALAMQAMPDKVEAYELREERARTRWWGAAAQRPAVIPRWPENSVGDRFFSQTWVADAAQAPRLADAKPPGTGVFAGDPAHWAAAMSTLIRSVVLDGAPVNDPAVPEILDMLTPVLQEELAQIYEEEEEWGYSEETTGPLFLLGGNALIEGAWAVLGDDPVDAVLAVLDRRMGAALASAGYTEGPDAKIIAGTLLGALTVNYAFEEPGDLETLKRLGHSTSGNVLLDLIDAEQVAPENALRLGLVILAALADLARTEAESVLPESTQSSSNSA